MKIKKSLLIGFLLFNVFTVNKAIAIEKLKKKKKSKCLIHMCSSLFYVESKCKKFVVKKKKAEKFGDRNEIIVKPFTDKVLQENRLCIKWRK